MATINITFAELFYKKWIDSIEERETSFQLKALETDYQKQSIELNQTKNKLANSMTTIEQLTIKVKELELFREREVEKLTCQNCKQTFESVYKLTSHKAQCEKRQLKV